MKIFIYRNLTRKCFSLRFKGKVISRQQCVMLRDCFFKVSEKGRQRVLRTGKKTVHAGVEGVLTDLPMLIPEVWVQLRYNPKELTHFVRMDNGQKVERAEYVSFVYPNIYALNPSS